MAAKDEPEIPDSDELPDDEQEDAADDGPHGHPHTPGYPEHRHLKRGKVEYQADEVGRHGGLDKFPAERHDGDSRQQQERDDERQAMADLGPLATKLGSVAGELGWETLRVVYPGESGSYVVDLTKDGREVTATIAYTE